MDDLEAARQEAIRVLCDAHAREEVSLDQFESRLARLKLAPNRPTLDAILADLDLWTDRAASLAAVPYRPAALEPDEAVEPVAPAEMVRITSVLASSKRAGAWTVPFEIHGLVILGELTLDLTDAAFVSDVVDIDARVTLGSLTLVVPAGTQVENEIEETLASSSHSTKLSRGVDRNGLLVRLRGRAILAEIKIKEKLPNRLGGGRGLLRRLLGDGSDR